MSADKNSFYVNENALCESQDIGSNTRIWGFTHVMKGAKIGSHCNVGEHVFIENAAVIGNGCTIKNGVAVWNKVVLEDDVFIGPYAVFTNDLVPRSFMKRGEESFLKTVVKQGASIGANATLVCGVTVGEYAMVGAGAVVCKDVPAHSLVVGNPGRIIGKICFCGKLLDLKQWCSTCECFLYKNSKEFAISKITRLEEATGT